MKNELVNILKKHVTFGNSKLPKSTMIFNMGSAMACPSAELGLCLNHRICYAKKAERMYPTVRPYRERQADIWLNHSAEELAEAFLTIIGSKRSPVKALRFNESGDFYSQACIEKLDKISEILTKHAGVVVYGYTARYDLTFENNWFNVRGSNFSIDGAEFRTVEQPSGKHHVCPGDCTKCSLCMTLADSVIEVIKH